MDESKTILIVGGRFSNDQSKIKQSGVVNKLSQAIHCENKVTFNGGSITDLKRFAKDTNKYDLVVWMPDLDNTEE